VQHAPVGAGSWRDDVDSELVSQWRSEFRQQLQATANELTHGFCSQVRRTMIAVRPPHHDLRQERTDARLLQSGPTHHDRRQATTP